MERNYRVYCYTNQITNQRYIGKTCRKYQSERAGKNGKNYDNGGVFWNDIQLYGWPNFKYEVIEDGLTKEEAEIKEREYIEKFNTIYPFGLNLQSGGLKGRNTHPITRRKQSQSQSKITHTGTEGLHWWTDGEIEICCEECPEGFYPGRKPTSDETRERMSEASKGRVPWNKGKGTPVQQYTKDGQLIAEYSSLKEAERQTGIWAGSIDRCCKGQRKTANGFIWKAI